MPRIDKQDRADYDKKYRESKKAARAEYQAAWRAENAEHLKARAAKRRLEKRAMCLIAGARVRSRSRGIIFELDDFAPELQKIIDGGTCQLSGVKFDLSPGRKPTSPSIDRINPELGYTPGNVRVICHALNAALGDWGEAGLAPIIAGVMLQKNAINAEAATQFIAAYMGEI
jgi:hypothetical protein